MTPMIIPARYACTNLSGIFLIMCAPKAFPKIAVHDNFRNLSYIHILKMLCQDDSNEYSTGHFCFVVHLYILNSF